MLLSVVMLASCKSDDPAPDDAQKEPTTFASGEDHLKYVANKGVKSITDAALQNYSGTAVPSTLQNKKSDIDVKILFQPALIRLLNSLMTQNGGGIDLSFLKSLEFKSSSSVKDNLLGTSIALFFNDVQLFDLNAVFDTTFKEDAAIRVPILSEDWLKVPSEQIKEALGSMLPGLKIPGLINTKLETSESDNSVSLPSKETVQTLIDRYVGVILDSIKNVTEGEEERTVGGVTEKLVTVKFGIDPETIIAIAKNVLTSLKGDADVKKIVEDASKNLKNEEGEAINVYDEFSKKLDELLGKVDKTTDEQRASMPTGEITVYTDKENNVKAVKITGSLNDKGSAEFFCGSLETEGKKGFECSVVVKENENSVQNVSVVSAGVVKDGKLTTDVVVSYNGEKTLTVKVEDLDKAALKEGVFSGKVSFGIGEVLSLLRKLGVNNDNLSGAALFLGGMNVSLVGSGTKESRNVRFAVANADGELLALECSIKAGSADDVSVIDNAKDVSEVNVDQNKVMGDLTEKIKEAGVPQEIIDAVPELLGSIMGGNGYDDGYDEWDEL